ncbi:hypothetical protein FHU10_4522 [Serratia fonticola]|jgi:type 1 fimbria pilin|uniref:Type 1 fimbrial protein n=1 Tax=Serratia fonticola TaxID=47917 RepID=A0A542D2R4_SERFO|nr:hypothetical protein FHU09_3182 [Serratia fonticola]TQI97371.1 hypothetical protein FHU11_2863 [Serratia fonticola]TVZ71867.1 hypothetical protein FHU10_4522 [Serratia fonticola]
MNSIILALTVLMALPFVLHAKQSVSQESVSGRVNFSGKITSSTCTILRKQSGNHLSTCYRKTSKNTNEFVTMALDNMASELMTPPIRETVKNNPSLQRITLIYN